jgi:hypothetical protein
MDEIVRRAIAEDEIAKRDFECWEANHQRQQRQQQEREHQQAALAREQLIVRQWLAQSRGEVQTTDFLGARNDDHDEGGNTGTGNDEAWTRWARGIAREEAHTAAKDLAHMIGAEVGKLERKQNDDFQDQINAIKSELSDLRAAIEDIRATIGSPDDDATRSTVVPMLALKGGRDAA